MCRAPVEQPSGCATGISEINQSSTGDTRSLDDSSDWFGVWGLGLGVYGLGLRV